MDGLGSLKTLPSTIQLEDVKFPERNDCSSLSRGPGHRKLPDSAQEGSGGEDGGDFGINVEDGGSVPPSVQSGAEQGPSLVVRYIIWLFQNHAPIATPAQVLYQDF
ncbi:hypothetical protein PG995_007865 [Apiospora arundinis]